MRELTAYEKKKHYNRYNCFVPPDLIPEGSEWGNYMENLHSFVEMGSSYGASDWFEKAAEIEYLDQYYDHVRYIYEGNWGYSTPENEGLPPLEEAVSRQDRAKALGVDLDTALKMTIDWAMKWREDHWQETQDRLHKEHLECELARLKK